MAYTNSSLVSYTKISPNRTSTRNHEIDTFTPHVYVGQVTAKRGVDGFADPNRKASSNYVIGHDGQIGLCVEEKDRAWTSSSAENDNRAITVEIASDTIVPYAITDKAYNSLINLAVDVCNRNGKKKMLWFGDKDKTLAYQPKADEMVITVHRWFANKACPGDYVYSRLGQIADEVTRRLGGNNVQPEVPKAENEPKTLYRVQIGAFSKKSNADNLLTSVKNKGFDAFVKKVDSLYKVQVGAFSKKSNADTQLQRMKSAGFADAFITASSVE